MHRYLLTLLLATLFAAGAWSQDSESGEDEDSVDTPAETEDDSDLDEQGFADDEDDDFVPSEDISTDQSIAFPTDI
jgi:hypothetical protein